MRLEVPAALAGERVDRAVALLTGLPRAAVARLVAAGAVSVGGRPVAGAGRRLAEGEALAVALPPPAAPKGLVPDPSVEVAVVHADGEVVVVDKPPGLVVHPGAGQDRGTLAHGLLARFPELADVGPPDRPGIVHRLDKPTSGLLAVARTAGAYRSLVAQLQARTVERRYTGLAWGAVAAEAGLVDAPVGRARRDRTRMAVSAGGRPARTAYEVVARFERPAPATLLACRLETGRTHQVRVHLAAIGHPLVGDAAYGGARPALAAPRLFLHAGHLAFDHPAGGGRCAFDSPLPPDLHEVLAALS